MKFFLVAFLLCFYQSSLAALSASGCQAKVKAAYAARTGKAMSDTPSDLIDICTGIIQEIQADAAVVPGIAVTIPSTSAPGASSVGTTTAPGTIQ